MTQSPKSPKLIEILKVGADVFAESAAGTISDVGNRLGMTKSIVHYYLANKAELLREAYVFARERAAGRCAIGLELTILSGMRDDPELLEVVRKAWKQERANLELHGLSPAHALLQQATLFGLAVAEMVEPLAQARPAYDLLKQFQAGK